MPQIFNPSADTWLRATVLVAAVSLLGAGAFASGLARSAYVTREGWPVRQPVPFSHKHHAGDLGIDCRYCHASVESGRYAGLPPTRTCMTCHSQLWTGAPALAPVRESWARREPIAWRRVAALPGYVYFDHHIHIDRGVPCVTCHGRVDEMPRTYRAEALQMRFCLDCHRDPGPHLRPRDQVTRMDWSSWGDDPAERRFGPQAANALHVETARLTDCNVCHR